MRRHSLYVSSVSTHAIAAATVAIAAAAVVALIIS
jgi:hypothetical protein